MQRISVDTIQILYAIFLKEMSMRRNSGATKFGKDKKNFFTTL